jgi:hypothetical protein
MLANSIYPMIAGWALFVVTLLAFILFYKKHPESFHDLKGEDDKWQAPELVIASWLLLFPSASLADIFMGLHASVHFWYSMDLILLFALGGRAALNLTKNKNDEEAD